ncbi:MAG: sigma-54 dependent transcriptional regulator [Alphaproteobacteria bacterium]
MTQAILVVEDEEILGKNVKRFLEQYDYDVQVATNGEAALAAFDAFKPDLVLLDYNLPGDLNGLDLLERMKALDSQVKVILMTAHGSVQVAVDAMKAGAYDYLSKPVVLGELKLLIDKAVGEGRLEGALSYYRGREAGTSGLDKILGASPPILAVKRRVEQLLEAERRLAEGSPPNVLITGETGTGKELVARALHYAGARKARPFIELNCASIPTDLVESELFGHERGAFTGAKERKIGLVEAADTGTFFLDEIGELDLAVQAKLLKFLEDKSVRRVGSVRDRTVDVRFIAATNRALESLVRDGKFRSDLYYRLNVMTIELPPLRARGDDVILLARHFLDELGRRYGRPGLRLGDAAETALRRHGWPGNVRELRNVMEQAALLSQGREIDAADLALQRGSILEPPGAPSPDAPATAGSADGEEAPGGRLAAVERDLIKKALADSGGNVTEAARILGISRDTLRYRIEKYRLRS